MFTETYTDITELNNGLTRRLALARKEDLDMINPADVQLHDIMVKAQSAEYAYNLKEGWLTKARWTALVRQYVDPEGLNVWLDLIEDRMAGMKRGQAFLRSKKVNPRQNSDLVSRRWGSCIIGWGFRAAPKPSLSMHSRTTFLGHIAPLDLGVAHHLARLAAERLGIDYREIEFVWHLENAQFHSTRSIGWWFTEYAGEGKYLAMDRKLPKVAARPALSGSIRQFRRYEKADAEGVLYGDTKYAAQLRPRKRWHTEVKGVEYARQFEGGPHLNASAKKAYRPLPSVPIGTLDLSALNGREGDETNAEYGCCCDDTE